MLPTVTGKRKENEGAGPCQSSSLTPPPVNLFPSTRSHLLNATSFPDISISGEEAVSSWPLEDRSYPKHNTFNLPGVAFFYVLGPCTGAKHGYALKFF